MTPEQLAQWEAWLRAGDSTLAAELAAMVRVNGFQGASQALRVPVWWLRQWVPRGGAEGEG